MQAESTLVNQSGWRKQPGMLSSDDCGLPPAILTDGLAPLAMPRITQTESPFLKRPQAFLIGLALLAITAAVYWPVFGFEFVNYDDADYVVENARVQAGLTLDNAGWAFRTMYFENWHPLTWLSYMFDAQVFGVHPGAFHLVNVFFHALNTLLVFAVLKRMTGAQWRSALAAGLFALHPLHVESVAWVAEQIGRAHV